MTRIETARLIPNQRWLRVLPPIVLVYTLNFIDRTNIAFAIAGGMNAELGLSASVAGLAAGIFSIGYLLLQVPGGDIAAKRSAKRYVTWSMIAWAIIAMGTGFAANTWQLMTLRFLLGVAEGGTYPALLVLISNWFPREESGRANSIFMFGASLANFVTGPLSGWIISLYGWREVFFIEGALPLVALLFWLPMVSDRPETTGWLAPEERDYIVTKLAQEQKALAGRGSYKEILADSNLWKLSAIYFLFQIGMNSYIYWLPTILRSLTQSGIATIGLLAALPYLFTMLGQYGFGALSDRTGNRRLYMVLPALCFAGALVLSVLTHGTIWLSYAFLVACGAVYSAHNGVFWTVPPALFPREIAGGARGIINGLGNLGGFVGPVLIGWSITMFHSTNGALYALAVVPILNAILIYTLPSALSHQIVHQAALPSGTAQRDKAA